LPAGSPPGERARDDEPVSALSGLQREFLAAITSGVPGPAAARVRGGALSPAQRLAVYSHNVFSNWRSALADTFPVVERLVGAAFFGEAARQYALAHPSTSGDLHEFGRRFADFLAAYPHAKDLAYLADVARLEWSWHESFHAAQGEPFDHAALARGSANDHATIRFRLHPAVRLIRSAHPVAAIWEANQDGRDGVPARFEGADCVLVHRPEFEVRVECLAPEDWEFLAALRSGAALGEAAAAFREGERLGVALNRYVACGAIAGFDA
jgi:hypothetical protein